MLRQLHVAQNTQPQRDTGVCHGLCQAGTACAKGDVGAAKIDHCDLIHVLHKVKLTDEVQVIVHRHVAAEDHRAILARVLGICGEGVATYIMGLGFAGFIDGKLIFHLEGLAAYLDLQAVDACRHILRNGDLIDLVADIFCLHIPCGSALQPNTDLIAALEAFAHQVDGLCLAAAGQGANTQTFHLPLDIGCHIFFIHIADTTLAFRLLQVVGLLTAAQLLLDAQLQLALVKGLILCRKGKQVLVAELTVNKIIERRELIPFVSIQEAAVAVVGHHFQVIGIHTAQAQGIDRCAGVGHHLTQLLTHGILAHRAAVLAVSHGDDDVVDTVVSGQVLFALQQGSVERCAATGINAVSVACHHRRIAGEFVNKLDGAVKTDHTDLFALSHTFREGDDGVLHILLAAGHTAGNVAKKNDPGSVEGHLLQTEICDGVAAIVNDQILLQLGQGAPLGRLDLHPGRDLRELGDVDLTDIESGNTFVDRLLKVIGQFFALFLTDKRRYIQRQRIIHCLLGILCYALDLFGIRGTLGDLQHIEHRLTVFRIVAHSGGTQSVRNIGICLGIVAPVLFQLCQGHIVFTLQVGGSRFRLLHQLLLQVVADGLLNPCGKLLHDHLVCIVILIVKGLTGSLQRFLTGLQDPLPLFLGTVDVLGAEVICIHLAANEQLSNDHQLLRAGILIHHRRNGRIVLLENVTLQLGQPQMLILPQGGHILPGLFDV